MKIHYMYTTISRVTACGLLEIGLQQYITNDPDEITCKSCLRCLDSYTARSAAVIEKLEQTSNEELLVAVIEHALGLHNYGTTEELVDYTQALLHRLAEIGFITEPEKVQVDWWYCPVDYYW